MVARGAWGRPEEHDVATQQASGPIDQITLQVVNNHLVTTCREMGVAMLVVSFLVLLMINLLQRWHMARTAG